MVVRKREGLWGFWRTEMAKQPSGGDRGPQRDAGRVVGGWKKGREETRLGRRGKGVYGKVMEKQRERIGRLMVRNEESGLGKYDGKVLARS